MTYFCNFFSFDFMTSLLLASYYIVCAYFQLSYLGKAMTEEAKDVLDRLAGRVAVKEILATLPDRERTVLEKRFGLDDGRNKTLQEIATQFSVTRERIRQIEAKALKKLKHHSRSRKLKPYLIEKYLGELTPQDKLIRKIFGKAW